MMRKDWVGPREGKEGKGTEGNEGMGKFMLVTRQLERGRVDGSETKSILNSI